MRYQLTLARDDGLFTNLYTVLGALDWCKENGSVPAIRFDSGPYLDAERGPNWWEYFFERVSDVDPMSLPIESREHLLAFSFELASRVILQRDIAGDLICRHIRIRPEVQKGLDSFWKEHLRDRFVVGVHLRGTDKFLEQGRVNLEDVFGHIEHLIRDRPVDSWCVFVATDEADCLRRVKEHFGDQVVYQDTVRSESGHALHKAVPREAWEEEYGDRPLPQMVKQPPYRIGLEAIRDALLLARCDVFLGSQSSLSYFVAAYNPKIPWMHVDRSIGAIWSGAFPELRAKEAVIENLREVVQERGRLINKLHQAAEEQRVITQSLQQVAEERGRLIENLQQVAQERGELIASLQQVAEERGQLIKSLNQIAEERGQLIESLHRAIEEQHKR
jgi:hypothetical protein